MSQRQIAERFKVSLSWVEKLLRRRRESSSIAALPHRSGPAPVFDEAKLQQLRRHVQKAPDATLVELRDKLNLKVSLSVIHRALVKLGLSYKKRRFVPPSKTVRM